MADIPRVEHTLKPNEGWMVSASELLNAIASAQPDTKEYTTDGVNGRVEITFAHPYRIKPGVAAIAVADDGFVSIHKSSGAAGWTQNADGDYTKIVLQAKSSAGAALTSTVIMVTIYKKFQT